MCSEKILWLLLFANAWSIQLKDHFVNGYSSDSKNECRQKCKLRYQLLKLVEKTESDMMKVFSLLRELLRHIAVKKNY